MPLDASEAVVGKMCIRDSLLTACARLNPHAHGTFALEGKGSGEFTPQQWRRDVAYLPQKPILTGKNVAEAIRLPWTLAIRSKGGKAEQLLPDERIRTTLDAMGCEDIDLERAPHDPVSYTHLHDLTGGTHLRSEQDVDGLAHRGAEALERQHGFLNRDLLAGVDVAAVALRPVSYTHLEDHQSSDPFDRSRNRSGVRAVARLGFQ